MNHILSEPQPVLAITTPTIISEAAATIERIMQEHGGSVEHKGDGTYVVFTFPANTMKQENWPRIVSERFTITFPDGYKIQQVHDHFSDSNNIYFPGDEFPAELQKQYQNHGTSSL
ncbi:MAG: hypothetical protein M3Z08_04855 [Chloroflexota bacterium]|nr:hypothetical protein [Chloroflexota bacterium]